MSEETDASVTADAAEAAPKEIAPDSRLRMVLTVEGDGETATIKAEAWTYAKDGTLIEAAPVKEREAENVVVALFDGGVFFQTASLLMGRTMALASGDLERAIHIDVVAAGLGIQLPPLVKDIVESKQTQRPTADTISEALAG